MEQRFATYRRFRRKFAITVYTIAAISCIVAVLQWVLIFQMDSIGNILKDNDFLAPVFLMIALVLITIFVLFENLRFIVPVSWIIALLIMLLVTWGVARIAIAGNFLDFIICCVLVAILFIVLLIVGTYIKHDMTLDIVVLCILAAIFLVISVILQMIFVVTYMRYIVMIYAGLGTLVVTLFILYHAQTINGGRYAEMRLDDYLLAVLILFHDYCIMLMAIYYIEGKLSDVILGKPIFNPSCDCDTSASSAGAGNTTTTTTAPATNTTTQAPNTTTTNPLSLNLGDLFL